MTRLRVAAFLVVVVSACPGAGAPADFGIELKAGEASISTHSAVCHGGNGQGGLPWTGWLETFGDCSDQLQVVSLGSNRCQ